jgi:hypothetical protein
MRDGAGQSESDKGDRMRFDQFKAARAVTMRARRSTGASVKCAQECGVSRSTVLRAIKSGEITGTKNANGDREVEPVQLFRHFKTAELRAMIADLRQDRDAWREQASKLALGAPKQHARLFKNGWNEDFVPCWARNKLGRGHDCLGQWSGGHRTPWRHARNPASADKAGYCVRAAAEGLDGIGEKWIAYPRPT